MNGLQAKKKITWKVMSFTACVTGLLLYVGCGSKPDVVVTEGPDLYSCLCACPGNGAITDVSIFVCANPDDPEDACRAGCGAKTCSYSGEIQFEEAGYCNTGGGP
jgi:hypothetical protein